MFTFRRFTKARVHTFLHLDRFQGAFSSGSLPSSEKKGRRVFVAFSSRIHVDARSDADTRFQDAFSLLSRSLLNQKRRRSERIFLSSSTCNTHARTSFRGCSFFSTCSWRMRKSWPGRLALRCFSFFFFSSYLQAGYFFVRVASMGLHEMNLTYSCLASRLFG